METDVQALQMALSAANDRIALLEAEAASLRRDTHWTVAYDVDDMAANNALESRANIYARVRKFWVKNGFEEFAQLSIYRLPNDQGSEEKVVAAVQNFLMEEKPLRRYIRRMTLINPAVYIDLLAFFDAEQEKPQNLMKLLSSRK